MTQDIDFLPPKYRELTKVRRRQLWRLLVVALFGTFVGSAATVQSWFRHDAVQKLAAVAPQHQEAVQVNQRLKGLQQELSGLRHQAQLVTYLRHPWPRTQLLATVVKPLPDSVALEQIRLVFEASQTAVRTASRRRGTPQQAASQKHPAEEDLAALRETWDRGRPVIYLAGLTSDISALHGYLGLLGVSPLVEKAELTTIESLEREGNATQSRFRIKLVVRQGHGQIEPADLTQES